MFRKLMSLIALLMAVIGLVAAPATQAGAQATATTLTGVSGNTYTSPTYGYSLTWDSSWQVLSSISVEGDDLLILSNGTSTVFFDASATDNGDPTSCVNDAVQRLKSDKTNQDVSLGHDTSGHALQGHTATTAYAVYTYLHHDGTSTPYADYLKCETLVPGKAVLSISEMVPVASYNAQTKTVQQLISHVTLASASQGSLAVGTPAPTTQTGTTAANKELIQRFYQAVLTTGNAAAADAFLAENVVDHPAPPQATINGRAAYEASLTQSLSALKSAFPDGKFTINDIRADGDEVIVRFTFTGTQTGALEGLAPTGKHVTLEEIDIFRIADGKIVEIWSLTNDVGVLQQLGVLPTSTPTGR